LLTPIIMMNLEEQLKARSDNSCELCGSTKQLNVYGIPPMGGATADKNAYICEKCLKQLEKKEELDSNHWTCLNASMWSEVAAVQVIAWRMLNRLKNETWAADALDMIYLDDDNLAWAKESNDHLDKGDNDMHRDCNGALLQNGDSITLIKTLEVKGSQISAKIGTVVKNIKIVSDNTEHIEGKIEGQQIVILTKFVRKVI